MTDNKSIDVGYGAIAVAFASLIVYALSLRNGFAFDDVVLVPSDPRVTSAQFGSLLTQPYWHDARMALYRPLTSLTFGLDWYIGKGVPAWFHFTNVLWHMLASLLAYKLLTRFFAPAAALLGGLLFALHPVHVEAVANVVGRGELIAATFFLAACVAWTAPALSTATRATLTATCYLLAMSAKESSVVLPAVLVLLDVARGAAGRGYAARAWRPLAPQVAVLVLFLLLRASVVGAAPPARLDPSIEVANTLGARLLTALQAWPIEAKLLLFPWRLLARYGPRILLPIAEFNSLAALGLTLLVATVVGGIVALARGHRLAALGLLWFPITILPVSNIIFPLGVLVAERTLYLPSFVIAFALAGAAAAVEYARPSARSQARLAAAAIMLFFAVRTTVRIPDWQSTDSIMMALVRDRPDAFRGQWHLARMARSNNDGPAALARYERALKLWPYREGLVQEAAAFAGTQGQLAYMRNVASWGATRWPNNINFHRLLATGAIELGDTAAARRAVLNGLQLNPRDTLLNQMQQAFGAAATVR